MSFEDHITQSSEKEAQGLHRPWTKDTVKQLTQSYTATEKAAFGGRTVDHVEGYNSGHDHLVPSPIVPTPRIGGFHSTPPIPLAPHIPPMPLTAPFPTIPPILPMPSITDETPEAGISQYVEAERLRLQRLWEKDTRPLIYNEANDEFSQVEPKRREDDKENVEAEEAKTLAEKADKKKGVKTPQDVPKKKEGDKKQVDADTFPVEEDKPRDKKVEEDGAEEVPEVRKEEKAESTYEMDDDEPLFEKVFDEGDRRREDRLREVLKGKEALDRALEDQGGDEVEEREKALRRALEGYFNFQKNRPSDGDVK